MLFELHKVRVNYTDKQGKERYFFHYYLKNDNGTIIRIKADDYKNHNNDVMLRVIAVEDKD